MMASAHSRYRGQLSIIGDDAQLLEIASAATGCIAERAWRRIYGVFRPNSQPYAIAAFESEGSPQSIFCAEIFGSRPSRADGEAGWVEHPVLGHVRIAPFTLDRSLNTLPSMMAAHANASVLRYRPLRRCTIRVHDGNLSHVGKIYPDFIQRRNRGQQLLAEGEALWRSARQGDIGFSTARPERWDAETRTLWQEYIEGDSIWSWLSPQRGHGTAFQLGRAAASLTCSKLEPARIFNAAAQCAASKKYAEELAEFVPEATYHLEQCLQALQVIHDQAGTESALRPIHGDMAPAQWLVAGSELYLLDFDDFALGDRELDVASFLHELEIGCPSGSAGAEIGNAFLTGYETIAGRLNPNLLAAYCCHKRIYRALTRARALRADGDLLALNVLQRSYEALALAEVAC